MCKNKNNKQFNERSILAILPWNQMVQSLESKVLGWGWKKIMIWHESLNNPLSVPLHQKDNGLKVNIIKTIFVTEKSFKKHVC